MKAAYIDTFGSAHNIQIGNLPKPEPKSDEILVKTIATTVNNVDTFVRAGKYPIQAHLPFVLGRDLVGEVVTNETTDPTFEPGDLVWSNSMGYEDRQGTTSEYVNVPKDRLFPLPTNVDPYQAVSALHATTTAVLLLTDLVHTTSGESILIQGGGGNVGQKLIETSKILDLKVTTTSAPTDFSKLTNLGAQCLDYTEPIYQGAFSYLIDTSGKNSLKDNIPLLKNNGKLLLITAPVATEFDAWEFYTKGKQILGFVLSQATKKQLKTAGHFINRQFEKGYYLNDSISKVPFTQVKKIHKKIDQQIQQQQRPVLVFS